MENYYDTVVLEKNNTRPAHITANAASRRHIGKSKIRAKYFIGLSLCVCVGLYVCLSVSLSVGLSVCKSIDR